MSRTLGAAAAWLGFIVGLLAGGEVEDLGSLAVAAVIGAAVVYAGSVAASRARTLPARTHIQRLRLGVAALLAGTALGLANLGANWLIAEAHPTLRALLTHRVRTLALSPLEGLVAAPLVEEVLLRLFLLSVLAWVAFLATKRAGFSFLLALVASSVFFAVLHLIRPFPGDPSLASLYRTTLVLKYTGAGLALGWVYWRWGMPYSILCHFAANGSHLVAQRWVF